MAVLLTALLCVAIADARRLVDAETGDGLPLASVSVDMTIRGKLIKTAFHSDSPVDVKCYVEVYITDREYLSTDEAKYLSKHKPTLTRADVKAPAGVPPLHPALQSLVNQVEGK